MTEVPESIERRRDLLLLEKEREIDRLSHRVEQLMAQHLTTQEFHEAMERVQRLEIAIFGLQGKGGLMGSMSALEESLRELREEELSDVKRLLASTKTSVRAWSLTLVAAIPAIIALVIELAKLH